MNRKQYDTLGLRLDTIEDRLERIEAHLTPQPTTTPRRPSRDYLAEIHRLLLRTPAPWTVADLAIELNMRPSAVLFALRALAADGLVAAGTERGTWCATYPVTLDAAA
jgi:DNA-binding transcriptional ArsR family regulator